MNNEFNNYSPVSLILESTPFVSATNDDDRKKHRDVERERRAKLTGKP